MNKCGCKHAIAEKLKECCERQRTIRKSAAVIADAASAEPSPLARPDLSVAARPAPVSGNPKGLNLP